MKNYYGFNTIDDIPPEESLKKHGLIVQNHKSDSYFCLYKHDDSYELGFASESEIKDFLEGKSWINKDQANKFYKDLDLEEETFSSLPFIYKLHSIINYFGVGDFMGKKTHEMSLNDAMIEYWYAKYD